VKASHFAARCEGQFGESTRAHELSRRFLEYWGNGDIDRDRVADACRKLNGAT